MITHRHSAWYPTQTSTSSLHVPVHVNWRSSQRTVHQSERSFYKKTWSIHSTPASSMVSSSSHTARAQIHFTASASSTRPATSRTATADHPGRPQDNLTNLVISPSTEKETFSSQIPKTKRVLLLNKMLDYVEELVSTHNSGRSELEPWRLCLDVSRGRLFVADWNQKDVLMFQVRRTRWIKYNIITI